MVDLCRSIIFNVAFFTTMFIWLLFGLVLLPFNNKYAFLFWHYFSKVLDFIIWHFAGIRYEIENENIIQENPNAIYAVRHESTWETLVLIQYFYRPVFILKKELLNIPLYGAIARKAKVIAVDRDHGARSLMDAVKRVVESIKEGHPIIIFPEGTRVKTGEHVEIKRGIALFYKKGNCPVIPIVHNSGKFWPRRGFVKHAGNIKVKILDPIPQGLSQDEFMERLNGAFQNGIEELKKIS